MATLRGAVWKTGTKNDKVYIEMWNYEDTERFVDAELSPDNAYGIGKALMDNAIRQGYEPPTAT